MSKPSKAKKPTLGQDLLQAMSEAVAHARGDATGYVEHRIEIQANEVKHARERLGMSQDVFAKAFGVSSSTLRKWEQGQRKPAGPARTLLRVIERQPKAVLKALAA
jgi:putative transcriptional regulator